MLFYDNNNNKNVGKTFISWCHIKLLYKLVSIQFAIHLLNIQLIYYYWVYMYIIINYSLLFCWSTKNDAQKEKKQY